MSKSQSKWSQADKRKLVKYVKSKEGHMSARIAGAALELQKSVSACSYMYYKILRDKKGKVRRRRKSVTRVAKDPNTLSFKIKSLTIKDNTLTISL